MAGGNKGPTNPVKIEIALSTMPEEFRNADFRKATGLPPFATSLLLTRLLKEGRLHHPRGNNKLWALVRPVGVTVR